MTLKNALSLWLIDCEASCSERTISGYAECLKMFFVWLEKIYPDCSVCDDVTKTIISEYMTSLRERGIKNTSTASYMRPVRTFFNWCFYQEYMEKQICYKLKFPSNDKEMIIPLYQHEVDSIDACFNMKTMLGMRDILIVHLMLDAGLRSSEVINLKCSDVMLDKNIMYIYGKGSKYRIMLLCPRLKSMLCKYMLLAHPQVDLTRQLPPEPLLYMSGTHEPLTNKSIIQLFSRLKSKSGVKRVHAHLCRHTFATSYIMGGGNMELLRMFLGHFDYSITQNYLHIANQFLLMDADIYKLDKVFFKSLYRIV